MTDRYLRNERMLSPDENRSLRSRRVAVVGCGGLGGYIIEMLARLGIGHLSLFDGDVFEESNLNRQLLSLPSVLGKPKALIAAERVKQVNPDVITRAQKVFLDTANATELLEGHDLVMDALDNIDTRFCLQQSCEKLQIPMIFGAIAGWYAQVCTVFPGDRTLDLLYPPGVNKTEETLLGNPSFSPALAASLQVAEALKVLLGRGELLRHRILFADTLTHQYSIIPLRHDTL